MRIYDLNGDSLTPKAGNIIFVAPPNPDGTQLADLNLALAAGDVDQDGADELAVASGAFRTVQDVDPGGDDTYLALAKVSAGGTADPLNQVTGFTHSGLNVIQQSFNSPMDVAVADLNNDGRAEIVLAVGPQLFLYRADDALTPQLQLSYDATVDGLPAVQDVTHRLGYSFLGVRAVGEERVEIALAAPTIFPESGSMRQSLSLVVYTAASDLQSLALVAEALNSNLIETHTNQDDYRRFALAVGGPNHLRLGEAVLRGTASQVSQPLVVLKAPPTHFDILGGETYDVSDCFGDDPRFSCGGLYNKFTATFKQATGVVHDVSTQVNSDWSIAESAGGNLSAAGVSLETNLTRKYGEGFQKIEGSTSTYTDQTVEYVWQDDRILATVMDYNVFEFPILANEQVVGHVLVVRPLGTPQLNWFGAKDWSGYAFVPNSQPGNILSYPTYVEDIEDDYENLEEPIVRLNNPSALTISWDTSFGIERNILYSRDADQETERTRTLNLEVGAKLGLAKDFGKVSAGLEVGVTGTYNRAEISTQKVTLSEEFEVRFVYGNINPAIADANYRITPFVYWAYNGALVVDYAIRVETSSPGFPLDWWRTHYGQLPDPAFLLPWRLERERLGYATPDYKLSLTKDILFDPPNAQAGEVVTLTARIHNYSLLDTAGPTAVRFYLGDPDAGGAPIVGLNGESEVLSSGPIPARGNAIVRMPWLVPEGLTYPRIYAVIDPDSQIDEVHEDNNKAYAILGAYDGAGPPLAGFSPATTDPESLTVKFNNTSGGEYTTVLWDFGDGNTSNVLNPTHSYAAPGAYLVTLQLSGGPNGSADTVQQTIQVGQPPVTGQPPLANNDSYEVAGGAAHTLAVLTNDSDPDGDDLVIVSVSNPAHGIVSTNGKTIVYTPEAGFLGEDSFTYTIDDGNGNQATATVTVIVSNEAVQTQGVFLPIVQQ